MSNSVDPRIHAFAYSLLRIPKKAPTVLVGACFYLEAAPRFELGNGAFAELCLTTWLCRPERRNSEQFVHQQVISYHHRCSVSRDNTLTNTVSACHYTPAGSRLSFLGSRSHGRCRLLRIFAGRIFRQHQIENDPGNGGQSHTVKL